MSTTTVTNTGIINNAGLVSSLSMSNLIFQSGAIYIHAGNGGSIPTATWTVSSKTIISGISNSAPTGLSQTFGNFEWNSSQTNDIDLNGNLTNVAGNLTISKTSGQPATRVLYFTRMSDYTLNVGGDLIIKQPAVGNTNVHFVFGGDGEAEINVDGDYKHESGNLVFVKVTDILFDGTVILNLSGDFLQSGGDIDFTSGDIGPAGQKGSMTIAGNFTQTAGTVRTTTGDNVIPNGLVTFNKAGVQTFNAAIPGNVSYINFVIADGSTLKLESGLQISRDTEPNWIGKLTVNAGATLDASTFVISSQITIDVPPSATAQFNLLPDAKLITANASGVQGSINTTNNLTASLSSDADYEFQGGSTGVFVTTIPNTIRDFIINNTSSNVALAMPLNITGTLLLAEGLLTTTETNFPTITATGTASEATSTSFVNGRLAKAGTTAFTFPVGKSGAGFRNIGITTPSGSATFLAEFFRAAPTAGTLEPTLKRVSSCEYWDLSKTAGAADVSANVVLSWEANSNCGGGAYVTNPITLRVAHLLGGTWIDEGRSASTGDNTAGTVTSSDAPTDFSPFALASISPIDNPLPVVFANVKAYEKNNGVQIEWSNLTEKDVAVYTIERAANGIDFSAIGQQSPASNQNDKADYNAFDANPNTGVNYYRIKAEETTGKIVYSKVLTVNLGKGNVGLRIYPNPVTGNQVNISLSNIKAGQYSLRVINTSGQDVYKHTITNQGSTMTRALNLPANIKPGVYYMVISGNGYRENKMFIVQ